MDRFIRLVIPDDDPRWPNELSLYHVGQAALAGSTPLRRALVERLGPDWERMYEQAKAYIENNM